MIDPQQLERRPNCVVGLSSQCCSRHAGKNGLLCAVLLLGSLAHLVFEKPVMHIFLGLRVHRSVDFAQI